MNRLPKYVDSSYFLKNFTLDFEDFIVKETVVYDTYKVQMISDSITTSLNLQCNFYQKYSECLLPDLNNLQYVVETLNLSISIKSNALPVTNSIISFNSSVLMSNLI